MPKRTNSPPLQRNYKDDFSEVDNQPNETLVEEMVMSKLFFVSATSAPGNIFDVRMTGYPAKAYRAENVEEARDKFWEEFHPRHKWEIQAQEITEEVCRQYPWVKDIPVSP